MTMDTFKIATNLGILSRPGAKPDFGTGTPKEQLTDWQRRTRSELTFNMRNVEVTMSKIAQTVAMGGTITAWHAGGKSCKAGFETRNGETAPHVCRNQQHRCNANFVLAQHLGADFDQLTDESEVLNHPLVKAYGSIIYHTPSSKPGKPKMRVIFLLDTPVTDGATYRQMVKAMLWKFEGQPDPACTDYCRLFYGNRGCEPTVTGRVLPIEIAKEWLKEYQAYLDSQPKASNQTSRIIQAGQNLSAQDEKRVKAFGGAVLTRACDRVRSAAPGERHYQLKKSAFNIFTFVAGGVLDEYEARRALEDAYRTHVANPVDMQDVLDWAVNHASAYPQGLPVEDELSVQAKIRQRREWIKARGHAHAS